MAKAEIVKSDGSVQDCTDFLGFFNISGASKECSRVLELELLRHDIDYYYPEYNYELGDTMEISHGDNTVFKGVIWEESRSDNDAGIKLTIYDKSVYLNKNETSEQVFTEMTPQDITEKVCEELGLDTGDLASGGPITINGRGMKAYDIIMLAYTKTKEETGKDYKLVVQDDKVHVIEAGKKHDVVLENLDEAVIGKLLNVSFRRSLDDVVNKVEAIEEDKDDEKKEDSAENKASQDQHGVLQKLVRGDDVNMESELKDVKKEVEIEVIGDWDMFTGMSIYLKHDLVGGEYYIIDDTHEVDDSVYYNQPEAHVVKLKLSTEFEMDERQEGQTEDESGLDGPVSGNSITDAADSYLGVPYVWGGNSRGGTDCSGFVQFVYQDVGIDFSPGRLTSSKMASNYASYGFQRIPVSQAQPGDVLWNQGHVGIYYGDNRVIEASQSKGKVVYNPLSGRNTPFTWAYRYVG